MRLPRVVVGFVVVAGPAAMWGAMMWTPAPYGIGCLVVLTVLALHPVMTGSALPMVSRLSIWAGLSFWALSVLATTRTMAEWRWYWRTATVAEMISNTGRPEILDTLALATVVCQLLACVLFGLALARMRLPLSRAVLASFAILSVSTAFGIGSVGFTLFDDPAPEPGPALPPEIADQPGLTATTSAMVAVNPLNALAVAAVLAALFVLVDRCAVSRPEPPAA